MEEFHSLLQRQLKKHLGDCEEYPPNLQSFIASIDEAYNDLDAHVHMLEHAMDLSSYELYQANSELRSNNERIMKQHSALTKLTRSKAVFYGDVSRTIKRLTETVAKTLDISRVSVWKYNADGSYFTCSDSYDLCKNRHTFGQTMTGADFSNNTAEHNTTPVMDVPILMGGRAIGIMRHEHIGPIRQWTADEKSFSGSITDLISLALEAAERRRVEADLRIRTSAMNAATDQIIITDIYGRVEFVNPSFERETGYSLDEIQGELPDFFSSDKYNSEFYATLIDMVLSGHTWHGEIILRRKNGDTAVEDVTITPIKNDAGAVERFIAIKRNVTEKKIYEKQLDHLAHHDHLTDLPNRLMFSDRLTQCIAQAARKGEKVAVLFLDLDQFKMINDTLGHTTGDILLKSVSERLQRCTREADMIARMGGDEFTAILCDIAAASDVEAITKRIIDVFSNPFIIAEKELFVTVSIGVGIYPTDGADVETLVKNADSAMYRAKEHGRNNCQFFNKAHNAAVAKRMQIENSMRSAIERNEFILHYQPRTDITTENILGAEALIRWHHPKLGLVPPSQFIPIAEENGLIIPISDWVMGTACAQNKLWQTKGLSPITIAVNVSARHFLQDNLVDTVRETLEVTGLQPDHLELELTESVLMHSIDIAVSTLYKLKDMGLKLSVDDFGTGYSSLTYLKRFPIDTVKIDQSFIRDLTTNPDDAAIARAVIAMAQSLKLKVIAEGVETLEQLQFLAGMGCDEIQGYFVSRPVASDEFESILRGRECSSDDAADARRAA
ncbi:MAG: EAL domain-containing protein [Armatimonadota bacterium]|nr:EAL domain-containing protein [bacterium]